MKKYASVFLNRVLFRLNSLLQHVEPWFAPQGYPIAHSPIFIIGAPRSGSTLLYQVLVNRFKFGYLANLHDKYFGFPYFVEMLAGKLRPKDFHATYKSMHGRTDELWGPSESGSFWYRWFRRKPQYVPLGEVDPKKMEQLKRVMAGLISAFHSPILFKNMPCALRLQPLASAFPNAVFLVIRRDLLMTAQSILETRQRIHSDVRIWWSMEPPDIDEIKTLEPEQQVVRQICSIYNLIDRDAVQIGRDRFLFITYEDFCADVHGVTNRVQEFLKKHEIEVEIRGEVPPSFKISRNVRLDQPITDRLIRAIDQIG